MTLAVPSYLIPGTWLRNLRAFVDIEWIRGVELLFFSYGDDDRRILDAELSGIEALAGRFEYSLHLPDPLVPEAEGLVELTRGFVRRYVVHPPNPEAGAREAASWASLLDSWRGRFGDDFLLEYTGLAAFTQAESEYPGLPLCADSGRLLLDGIDPVAWMAERASRIGEVHLHAARGGKDHQALSADDDWLPEAARFLAGTAWRVELEVFSMDGAASSASALTEAGGSL